MLLFFIYDAVAIAVAFTLLLMESVFHFRSFSHGCCCSLCWYHFWTIAFHCSVWSRWKFTTTMCAQMTLIDSFCYLMMHTYVYTCTRHKTQDTMHMHRHTQCKRMSSFSENGCINLAYHKMKPSSKWCATRPVALMRKCKQIMDEWL